MFKYFKYTLTGECCWTILHNFDIFKEPHLICSACTMGSQSSDLTFFCLNKMMLLTGIHCGQKNEKFYPSICFEK